MRALDRVEVLGFKSIRKMDLKLRSLNVLIGANGAGKSNFITIFSLLNHIVENNLQRFVGNAGGADSLLYFGHRQTNEIVFRLHFGSNGYEAKLSVSKKNSLFFS